jgi:hypothetical protein
VNLRLPIQVKVLSRRSLEVEPRLPSSEAEPDTLVTRPSSAAEPRGGAGYLASRGGAQAAEFSCRVQLPCSAALVFWHLPSFFCGQKGPFGFPGSGGGRVPFLPPERFLFSLQPDFWSEIFHFLFPCK